MCISVYIKPTTRGKATEAVEAQTGKVIYLRWPSKWKSQESNFWHLIAPFSQLLLFLAASVLSREIQEHQEIINVAYSVELIGKGL